MLISYTQDLTQEVGVFPSSGSNPVMMTCQEIMSQAPSGYNGFIISHSPYGNGYAGFIVFININGDTIYLADLEYLLGRTDNSKNCAGIGASANISIHSAMYRVQSQYTHTLQSVSSISTYTQTKDGIEYRWESFDSSWTTGDIVYFPSSVTNIYENGQPLITYQWSSVPAISGKNGILSLPMLDTLSWYGTPITNAERSIFTTLPDAANLRSLYSNVVYGEPYPIVFAGDEHVAIITWTNATTFSIDYKWKYDDIISFATVTYTLSHAQDEVWFAFVSMISGDPEDPEQQVRWARPSFVIRDANSGKYSFGIESITEAYYPAFYEWHIAGFSADFSVFGDPNEEEGGEGYGDIVEDPIDNPLTPSIGAVATGFTRLYYITGAHKDKLTQLMDWFNDDDLQFINQIFKGDPMQALIGVNICPLPLTAVGSPNMYFLGLDTGIASDGVIADQFQEIDCGSIDIDLWMKDTYLDFAPYTSIKAVLPYIGAIDLNTDDLKYKVDRSGKRIPGGATLSLKYVIDTLTGACVAHLFVNGSLHYEASGSCFVSIPLTQKDYTSEVNSIKQAVAGVADTLIKSAGLAAMGVGGPAALAVGAGASAISSGLNVSVQHPNIKYIGGSTGAVSGYMGIDRPYLLVEMPVLARPANDEHYFGMPSYITGTIGSFQSSDNSKAQYAKFSDVHLENINCTETERAEILQALKEGVLLDDGSAAPNVTPETQGNKVIVLLHNRSERNVIGKTFVSGSGNRLKIEGANFFDESISAPVFTIAASEVYTYNYAYVPALHRYYYITDIVALKNNMLELHMQVDPLQSFKDEIKACKAICSRSEWRNNYLINDGAMMVKQPQLVSTLQFKKNGEKFSFTRASAGFIVIVASGATT